MSGWQIIGCLLVGVALAVVIVGWSCICFILGWRSSALSTLKYMEEIENKRG